MMKTRGRQIAIFNGTPESVDPGDGVEQGGPWWGLVEGEKDTERWLRWNQGASMPFLMPLEKVG